MYEFHSISSPGDRAAGRPTSDKNEEAKMIAGGHSSSVMKQRWRTRAYWSNLAI